MTWQIVVLVLVVLAYLGFNGYIGVLNKRTEVAEQTLFLAHGDFPEIPDAEEARLGNGNS